MCVQVWSSRKKSILPLFNLCFEERLLKRFGSNHATWRRTLFHFPVKNWPLLLLLNYSSSSFRPSFIYAMPLLLLLPGYIMYCKKRYTFILQPQVQARSTLPQWLRVRRQKGRKEGKQDPFTITPCCSLLPDGLMFVLPWNEPPHPICHCQWPLTLFRNWK